MATGTIIRPTPFDTTNVKFAVLQPPANSASDTFITTNGRHVVIMSDGAEDYCGIYTFNTTTAGVITITALVAAPGITPVPNPENQSYRLTFNLARERRIAYLDIALLNTENLVLV